MFSLFSGLYQYLSTKPKYNILIIGLDKSGKTALLERIKSIFNGTDPIPFERIRPTVGLNIGEINAGSLTLGFWDLGGQAGLRSIWEKYEAESDAVIFVIDASDYNRIDELKSTFSTIIKSHQLGTVPFLILSNKQDLKKKNTDQQILTEDVLNSMLELRNYQRPTHVKTVSALTGYGIQEGLEWLVQLLHNVPPRKPKSDN